MTFPTSFVSFTEFATLLLTMYWMLVIVVIVAEDREPTTTLAWILVLSLLPVVGVILYLLVGRDWKHRVPKQPKTRRATAAARNRMEAEYEPYCDLQARFLERADDTLTERVLRSIAAENDSQPMPVRDFTLLASGAEFFSALKRDIASAKRFVHLQYYIWECDELTGEICDLLLDRLKDGVEVRLSYDWFGCLRYRKSQLRALKKAGAHVHADATQLWSINYRNHRKIAVIDAEIGFTGGHNVGQEYVDGGKRYPEWRDTSARITGPGVGLLQKWFAYRWSTSFGDASLFDERYFPAEDPDLTSGEPLMVGVVAQGVDDPWESARRTHAIAISGAKRTVRIQSPYFVPDPSTYDTLINMALAGIEVHLMMTGWVDHAWAYWTAQSYWRQLIEAGGHVYTYEAGFFHAKTITIDSELCAVGTMNLDLRSLRLQRELMLWIYDALTAIEFERVFDADLKQCTEVTLDELAKMGPFLRFRNSAGRLGANLL